MFESLKVDCFYKMSRKNYKLVVYNQFGGSSVKIARAVYG